MIKVNHEVLLSAWKHVNNVAPKRSTIPVVENALVDVGENFMNISATDLQKSFMTRVPIENPKSEKYSLCIPVGLVYNILTTANTDDISISFKEKTLTISISHGGSTRTVKGIYADEFPVIKNLDNSKTSVDAKELQKQIERVIISAMREYTNRPMLACVKFLFAEDKLILMSGDGFRATLTEFPANVHPNHINLTAMVTRDALETLLKIISGTDVQIEISKHQISFHTPNGIYSTTLVDSEFPNILSFLDTTGRTSFEIYQNELADAIKQIGVYEKYQEADNGGYVLLTLDKNELIVQIPETQLGEAVVRCNLIKNNVSAEYYLAINHSYLLDFCKVFSYNDKFEFWIQEKSELNHVIIHVDEQPNYSHVIMPMAIR